MKLEQKNRIRLRYGLFILILLNVFPGFWLASRYFPIIFGLPTAFIWVILTIALTTVFLFIEYFHEFIRGK